MEVRTNSPEDVFLGTRPLYVKVFERNIRNSVILGSRQLGRLWCENPRVSTPLKSLPEIFDLLGPKLDTERPTRKRFGEVQDPVVGLPPARRR